jgi:hypothetical protein
MTIDADRAEARSEPCVPIAEILHAFDCESPAHAEMSAIRGRYDAEGDLAAAERRRYATLWVAIALRRSPCARPALGARLLAGLERWEKEREALGHERARHAVDTAFHFDDDRAMEDLEHQLPR